MGELDIPYSVKYHKREPKELLGYVVCAFDIDTRTAVFGFGPWTDESIEKQVMGAIRKKNGIPESPDLVHGCIGHMTDGGLYSLRSMPIYSRRK